MQKHYHRKSPKLLTATIMTVAAFAAQPGLCQLRGGVLQERTLPGEESQQVRPEDSFAPPGDPFSNDEGMPQQPQQEMFPQDAPPFNLDAQQAAFPGQPMQAAAQAQPPAMDPDSSPDMQLLWDQWHRRIAGAVFKRYHFFAKKAFARSRPLRAVVRYVVTRDGQVKDVKLVQKSSNFLYNMLIQTVVRSMNGDMALLQFPPGSQRQFVIKHGVFSQNVGQSGFRYTTGDRERLSGR